MSVVIGRSPLTLEEVERVARGRERVELATEAMDRIRACRLMLEEKIEAGEVVYGVNTGIGELSEVALSERNLAAATRVR